MKLLLKNCQLDFGIRDIFIEKGIIKQIGHNIQKVCDTMDLAGYFVRAGIIDPHVHMRDMQQAQKEDWFSGSLAALKGGVTTVFDMPNTIPATTNESGLLEKRMVAEKSLINKKFYLGSNGRNLSDLEKILEQKPEDVIGIKVFLADSNSNGKISNDGLREVMKIAKKYDVIVAFHSELDEYFDKGHHKDLYNILHHNKIRNRKSVIEGLKKIIDLTSEIGSKSYVCHVSTAEEIELFRQYKNDIPIFCEITPHHLLINEQILHLVGNIGKVNPPLRTKEDNESLWNAIEEGIVDTIGSDHAPHTLEEKTEVYVNVPAGFPGLETSLPLLMTSFNRRKINLHKLTELTTINPAKIFNLKGYGDIEANNFADLVIVDPNEKWIIKAENFASKAKYTPFENLQVKGRVISTFVHGKEYKIEKMRENE